jgi:hypothetical protein
MTPNASPQLASTLLWSGNPLSTSRTRLPFLSALTAVNAITLSFDSTDDADNTVYLTFSDISQGKVVANPLSSAAPPGACQGGTLGFGFPNAPFVLPGKVIIPPQPFLTMNPAYISSWWQDCQGNYMETWHCYVYSFVGPPRPQLKGKFYIKTKSAVLGVRG